MKEFWQKTAVILLFVAIAAAVSVGQKGKNISGEGGSKSKAKLIKEQENAEGGKGQAGAKKDEGGKGQAGAKKDEGDKGQESAKDRVMREGKLVRGWAVPPCIVIDPGHGGYDPGKIGAGGLKEKDVNLSIAKLLRENLEAAGVRVVLTREDDVSLCEEGEERAKVRDLKRRIQIMEEARPVAAISIHQNSYPEEQVRGSQVFYYHASSEGKTLAQALQDRLKSEADPENGRQIKENDSYYLLKKTSVHTVIAECGFLSNPEEAEKLGSADYQECIAWALYLGIMDYLEEKGE